MRRRLLATFLLALAGCNSEPTPEAGVDTTLSDDGQGVESSSSLSGAMAEQSNDLDGADLSPEALETTSSGPRMANRKAPTPDYDELSGSENFEDAGDSVVEEPAWREPRGATPRGNPRSWANANDYPSRALREEREGVTRFTVETDPNGRVSSCAVTSSSGDGELDQTTCSLIQRRARFNPATDSTGVSVPGTWSSSVRWSIPR